jgi:hypothetical protein
LADVAVAALIDSRHKNKMYSLTGLEALTFGEMADGLSEAVGRTISFVDVPPETMREALDGLGFPAWQADGLVEEFEMYRRGEAAGIESGVTEASAEVRGHSQTLHEIMRRFSPNEKTGGLSGALRRPGEFRFETDLGSGFGHFAWYH